MAMLGFDARLSIPGIFHLEHSWRPLRGLRVLTPIDWFSDIKGTRAATRELLAANQPPADPRISVRDTSLPGAGGSRIPVRIYTPADAEERTPAVLYCHGGAFVTGDLDTGDSNCREICLGGGAVVVSVAYRLALSTPSPRASTTATPPCAGSPTTRPNSASTRPGSASAGARRGAASPPPWP